MAGNATHKNLGVMGGLKEAGVGAKYFDKPCYLKLSSMLSHFKT